MITASLVLYKNRASEFVSCIDSVISSGIFDKFVIIDNSPDPIDFSFIKSEIIELFHCPDNPGFGAAHNFAFQKCKSSNIHFVLNPDISFDANVPKCIVEKFSTDADIGLIMPKIVYPDGSIQRLCKLLPTPLNLVVRRFLPFASLKLWLDRSYELHEFGYDCEIFVPSLSGCFMAIRSELYRKVNGFDENFFMYLEDIDITRRIGMISKTIFWPDVVVTHVFQKGSYKSKRLLWIHVQSAFVYFNKWGWLFDRYRKRINTRTLANIKCLNAEKMQ